MTDPSPTLYQRLLGESFSRLHPTLRRFHGSCVGGAGVGTFRVTRGKSLLCRLIAALGGLPANQDNCPVYLRIEPQGAEEKWTRTFAGRPMITIHKAGRGMLLESAGPVTFGFEVVVEGGGLSFNPRKVWLLGIPVPRWLGPSPSARVVPQDAGWHTRVTLNLPLIGQVICYEGFIQPDEGSAG